MKRIIFLSILLLLFAFTACNDNTVPDLEQHVSAPAAESTVTVMHKDFRAVIPESWEETDASSDGQQVYVYNLRNKAINDATADAITIHLIPIPANFTSLDTILSQGLKKSMKSMPDLMLIGEPKQVAFLGEEGRDIRFTGTAQGIRYEFMQTFSIVNSTLYTITYACPIGACDNEGVFNSVKDSIVVG